MPLGLNKTQFKALSAAWLGWCFDGLDGFLYVMVGRPFVQQLVLQEHGLEPGAEISPALANEITLKFTIIGSVFLIGWAIGGVVFGRIGDRIGRARTLTLTILTYAIFTGLCYFSESWWHLLLFRFISALGIGGEWAAGSALVSETLPKRHRAWGGALLQSGYIVGSIIAAYTTAWLSIFEYRTVFLVGVLPAFITFWIRGAVPEPEQWTSQRHAQPPPPVRELFSTDLCRTTILTILLVSVPLTTVWAFWLWLPEVIRGIPEVKAWSRSAQQAFIVNVIVLSLVFNIVGNFFSAYLARFTNYKLAFSFMFLGGLLCFVSGFHRPPTLANIHVIACSTSFFILGFFGMLPLYLPRLFPTLLRTLGCGVTYNVGRLIAAAGTFASGWLVTHAQGPNGALWWTGMLYIPGLIIAVLAPRPTFEMSDGEQ